MNILLVWTKACAQEKSKQSVRSKKTITKVNLTQKRAVIFKLILVLKKKVASYVTLSVLLDPGLRTK